MRTQNFFGIFKLKGPQSFFVLLTTNMANKHFGVKNLKTSSKNWLWVTLYSKTLSVQDRCVQVCFWVKSHWMFVLFFTIRLKYITLYLKCSISRFQLFGKCFVICISHLGQLWFGDITLRFPWIDYHWCRSAVVLPLFSFFANIA